MTVCHVLKVDVRRAAERPYQSYHPPTSRATGNGGPVTPGAPVGVNGEATAQDCLKILRTSPLRACVCLTRVLAAQRVGCSLQPEVEHAGIPFLERQVRKNAPALAQI